MGIWASSLKKYVGAVSIAGAVVSLGVFSCAGGKATQGTGGESAVLQEQTTATAAETEAERNANAHERTRDNKSNEGRAVSDSNAVAMDALRAVHELVRYGRAERSGTALIAAAEMLHFTPTRPFPADIERERDGEDADVSDAPPEITVAALIAEAKEFAANNPNLMNIIETFESDIAVASATRQRVGGPLTDVDIIPGNSRITYTMNFVAGRPARVQAIGSGNTDLDLYVYDDNGNLIAQDIDYTDFCIVGWTPVWTGRFRIVLVNLGPVPNRYVLTTS